MTLGVCRGVLLPGAEEQHPELYAVGDVFGGQCTTTSALETAKAVGILGVFGGSPESFKADRCFADVHNQYFNPTEEPHKPGTKEKRKKAASFQTVSQLHKVRASPSSRAMGEKCSEGPTGSPFPANTWFLAHPGA